MYQTGACVASVFRQSAILAGMKDRIGVVLEKYAGTGYLLAALVWFAAAGFSFFGWYDFTNHPGQFASPDAGYASMAFGQGMLSAALGICFLCFAFVYRRRNRPT